jgi:hypothetical protein
VADVDFAKCEQPDELIQLAWNAGLDKKAVIREGVDAAGLLLAGERNEIVTLFWPVPRPLEAVDRWSENPHPDPPVSEKLRPYASAVVPGCILGALVTHFIVAPRMSEDSGLTALVWIMVASIAALGVVFKLMIGAALRRRASRLDEDTALGIVLEQLRLGMTVNAALVPRACVWIRRGLTGKVG